MRDRILLNEAIAEALWVTGDPPCDWQAANLRAKDKKRRRAREFLAALRANGYDVIGGE